MKKELFLIGACGLDCDECDIYAATDNPQLAGQLADWMKKVSHEQYRAGSETELKE